mmetsp:Transcript_7072/g.15261  ORF Transcript_7072/g.15261 Transcript_7072/m.15261 type:complete len:90 (+) Transcript_7072:2607-2876(+)
MRAAIAARGAARGFSAGRSSIIAVSIKEVAAGNEVISDDKSIDIDAESAWFRCHSRHDILKWYSANVARHIVVLRNYCIGRIKLFNTWM